MKVFLLITLLITCLLTQARAEQVHTVSIRTLSGVEAGVAKWQATLDYLTDAIPGHRFVMVPYPHLDKQLADASQQRFEFLLTNPATYVEIKHKVGATALTTLINKRNNTAQMRFGSVLFTRADRDDILSLQDLKGKHLKAVSPLAFGGWTMVWREMRRNHFDPYSDLGELSFADGNQPAVVAAVAQGKADAGVVRTDMLERLDAQGKIRLVEFRILHNRETQGFPFFHSTPLYPEWPFAAMPGVEPELQAKVKQALLSIRPLHTAAQQGHYIGWTEALDYQGVDDLLKELAIGPYQQPASTGFDYHYLYPAALVVLLVVIIFSVQKPVQQNNGDRPPSDHE